jgi:LPXTG-motif cell wall-anchored protein
MPYANAKQEVDDSAVDGATNPPPSDHSSHGGPAFDPNTEYPPPHNGDQWGDIIPPFYADGSPGYWSPLNWDAGGQAIFYAGCTTPPPPPPEVGSLDVVKIVTGEGTPDEGTEFTVEIVCDSDGFDTTLTFDENGDLLSGVAPITDIPDGTNCTVSETDAGGADDVEINPNDGQVEIEGDETVTVTVTNTFEEDGCEPNCPVPTAFSFSDPTPPTCEDVGNFIQAVFPGVSIVVDPAFDGPGTYTVTATLDDPNAVWADIGGNEPRSKVITVEDALGFQSDDPNAPCFLEPPPPPPPPPPGPPAVCVVFVDGHLVTIVDPKPGDCAEVPPGVVPTCEDDPSQAGCVATLPRTGTNVADLGALGAMILAAGGGTLFAAKRRRAAAQEIN